jgi:hypothetical protein
MEEMGTSAGRRKKSAVMLDDDEPMEDHESVKEEIGQTEASGWGFSQGVRRDAEEDKTSPMDAEEQQEEQPQVESQDISNNEPAEEPEQTEPEPPTDSALYKVVDSIFSTADKNTMTVKQVNKSVAEHFGLEKVDKKWKGLIKERLTKLVSGEIGVGEGLDDGSGKKDGEQKKKKKSKEKRVKNENKAKKVKQPQEDVPDEDSFQGDAESEDEVDGITYDSSSSYDEARPTTKHKRTRRSKGKMAQYIRDHATKLRTRQLEEARIRSEEMGKLQASEDAPKLSEEDRARAQAIAARFDTNKEEEVVKREEERRGLIEGLRRKRLEIITLESMKVEVKQEVADGAEQKTESGVMVDLDDDEEESSDEGDELELVAPATKAKRPSALDCLNFKPGDTAPRIERSNNPKPVSNPRLALRNALRAKQVQAGNRWLAR